jgi:NAD(P)-dependent dehydrogenase (short-subunit alcohol dehydrogenase family)
VNPKAILVAGASSGIGAACALRLARAGHRVVGVSRSGTVPCSHENLSARVLDIRDPAAVELVVKETVRDLGRLDALVNSAGVAVAGSLEDSSIELIRAQIETNLLGASYLIRAAAPYLRQFAPSRLIHISSIAVDVPLPMQSLYCASHAGVNGLCASLRYELEPLGVRVIVIAPGNVRTGMTAHRRTAIAGEAYKAAAKAVEANDQYELHGVESEQIAEAVEQVLFARFPPDRRAVGHWHERMSVPLKGLLPGRWFRKIIASHYGISGLR